MPTQPPGSMPVSPGGHPGNSPPSYGVYAAYSPFSPSYGGYGPYAPSPAYGMSPPAAFGVHMPVSPEFVLEPTPPVPGGEHGNKAGAPRADDEEDKK